MPENILPATIADVPAMADLLTILFRQEANFTPHREKQERALRMILETGAGHLYLARVEGRVAGMLSLLRTISTAEGGPVCWLEDMVVDPWYRSTGVGSRLLQHAVADATRMGYLRITLLTDHDNAAAIRFYERHGFITSPMVPLRRWLA